MAASSAHRARAGFTLIELLAVLLIIGILSTYLITQLGTEQEVAKVQRTRQELAVLSAAIDSYERDHGDYPPSSFADDQGVDNAGTNVGGEALVVALWSKGWEGGGHLEDEADHLVNTDGDSSAQQLTDFGSRALFELSDAWGNPIAYLHRRDYGNAPATYVTYDPVTGEERQSQVQALKNPRTGRYYESRSFQLFSAGSDGLFGTDDDVTSFEKQEEE